MKLTEAQVDLLSEQDISEATFEFLGAIVNAGFIAFDVMDAVKTASLIRKCNLLAPDTRKLLKNSKRFGERAFQTLNLEQLNTLTPQFSEYFSGNIDFIVDMYTRLNKTSAYTLPDDLLKNVTKESENFDDFARFIGKNQNIASEEEKVEYIQKAFLMLSPSEKGKLTIPADAKYVKGFGPEGRVEYLWPDN